MFTGGGDGGAVERRGCGEVSRWGSEGQPSPASVGTVEEPAQHHRDVCGQVGTVSWVACVTSALTHL